MSKGIGWHEAIFPYWSNGSFSFTFGVPGTLFVEHSLVMQQHNLTLRKCRAVTNVLTAVMLDTTKAEIVIMSII